MDQTSVAVNDKKLSSRDFWCFASGTFGRDIAYQFFVNYLLTFILFTKTLTDIQFTCVSIIIIAARIFDAFNDPFMGGVVENTRTRFGKFKPWIALGALLTSIVIIVTFSVPADNWHFIGLLAVMYLMFSITYTMNDIAYWGMLPSLARGTHDRNKLMSVTQLFVSAGAAVVAIAVPALTTTYASVLGGSASSAYRYLSIAVGVVLVANTAITFFGVHDDSNIGVRNNEKRLSIKEMFKVLKNNDQLLYATLIMILYSVGTGVVSGGLSTTYIYFEFGYNGMLTTAIWVLSGITSVAFTVFFPFLAKRIGRTKLITFSAFTAIAGYVLMLFIGVFVKNGDPLFTVLGMKINAKYLYLVFANALCGLGGCGFYTIMFLNMSNTVEYNEWKTGKREESLIFSLRPFSAKFSSAIVQLFITVIYLAVGVLQITNGISELDKRVVRDAAYTNADMLADVNELLNTVGQDKKIQLCCCMCIIPVVFLIVGIIIYKKKFILDDETFENIKKEISTRAH